MRGTAAAFALVWLVARSAGAQPSDADRAAATQLFKDGRALLEQKRFAEACPLLAESQRLDPGGGTLLNLALCHEGEGRLATAWTEFTQALGLAYSDERPDRAEVAQQHIDDLEPRLSRLSLVVSPEADLPGLEIERDGTVLGRPAWGSAIPVDAGHHVVEVSAPGHVTAVLEIEVPGDAAAASLIIPRLEPLPPDPDPVVVPPPLPLPVPLPPPVLVPAPPPPGVPPTRVASYVAFGFAGAGVVVGIVTGALALARRDDSDALCEPICSARAYELNDEAKPLADAATVSLVLAGASAALGTTLLIVSLPFDDDL